MARIHGLVYRLVLTGGLLASGLLAQPASADQTQTTPGGSPSPAVAPAPAPAQAQAPAAPQSPAIGVPPMVSYFGTQQTLAWAGPVAPLADAMWDTFGRGR